MMLLDSNDELDVMSTRFREAASAFSRGTVIFCSTSAGPAPGNEVYTDSTGRVVEGYRSTAILGISVAATPIARAQSTKMVTGRSTEYFVMLMCIPYWTSFQRKLF